MAMNLEKYHEELLTFFSFVWVKFIMRIVVNRLEAVKSNWGFDFMSLR